MPHLTDINTADPLRQITYLQLCVVPSFIETYLSTLSPHEIKCTFFLYMQTFFEINSDHFRLSSNGDLSSIFRECCRRPIGQQMFHLLKTAIAYYISHDYPLHTFFLDFDPNTESSMIQLQKVLLKELEADLQIKEPIKIILLCLDLALEIYEIKKGNAKFLLINGGKGENFEQQAQAENLRRKLHMKVVKKVQNYQQNDDLTENLRDLCTFCLKLAECYEYVLFSKTQKEIRGQKQQDGNISRQDLEQPIQAQQTQLCDPRFWHFSQETDTFEMISFNYISSLKNLNATSTISIEKLKNSIIVLLNRLAETKNEQDIQLRVDSYSLLLATKLLSALKCQRYKQLESAAQLQESFKQVMQFQIASIRSTFYFLTAFLQLDIQDQALHTRLVKLIGWIMAQYRKYSFKSQEMIYADFIASSLDLLVSWKQSLKPEEEEKQIETVLNRLASKTKSHGENTFGLFFQTLNPKLFEYVVTYLLKARGHPLLILKVVENPKPIQLAFIKFQQKIHDYIAARTYPQQKQRTKQLEASEAALNYAFMIYLTRNETSAKQELVFMRLYNLLRLGSQIGKKQFKEEIMDYQVRKCLSILISSLIQSINTLQSQYSFPQNKKNQGILGNAIEVRELQSANLFIEQSLHVLTFLSALMFTLDPTERKIYSMYALIFDSYSQSQSSISQTILQLYNSSKTTHNMIWSEGEFQTLRFSRKYDTLEIFYEDILLLSTEPQKEKLAKATAFKQFSKEWCSQEMNYQWLSDQKSSRIRLFTLKGLCHKIQADIDGIM